MQLVLGLRSWLGLAPASGAPLPAPPERFRLSERAKRILRRIVWAIAFVLLGALGALHGASVAIGADGVSSLAAGESDAQAIALPSGRRERELHGEFWRPAGSDAERPPARIGPREWQPEPQ
ncbi:MAG: hypothetical protein FJ091_07870 [Deltaproteobacteria bacterium]|nr:hypothetical protein [Deltaproteobacteria bacterium]